MSNIKYKVSSFTLWEWCLIYRSKEKQDTQTRRTITDIWSQVSIKSWNDHSAMEGMGLFKKLKTVCSEWSWIWITFLGRWWKFLLKKKIKTPHNEFTALVSAPKHIMGTPKNHTITSNSEIYSGSKQIIHRKKNRKTETALLLSKYSSLTKILTDTILNIFLLFLL